MENDNVNNNHSEEYSKNMYQPAQNIQRKVKPTGSVTDIIVMIINYFLTEELISSLFTSNSFNFTWRTTVVYFLFFITATVYIVSRKKEISLKAIPAGIAALLLSCSFAFYSLGALSPVIFLSLIVLSGIYCVVLTKSNVHSFGSYFSLIDVIKCEVFFPVGHIFMPYPAMFRGLVKRERKEKKHNRKLLPVIFGVILAIPVLAVIIPLLIKSDAAFSSVMKTFFEGFFDKISLFITKIFGNRFSLEGIFSYVAALFVAPYIFSVMFSFRYGVQRSENKDTSGKYLRLRKASKGFLGAFLAVICIVYAVYLLSQTAYFFSAFTGHLPSGVKISVTEYARSGFFELMKIAVINFLLVAISVIFSKRENGKITGIIKVLNVFLCVFTIIISATSISKIVLYMNRFGFTEKRIYVFVFDIVLIIAFLSVILRFFIEKFPYMKVIISSVCVCLIVLGLSGTNKFIADRNAEAYLNGKLEKIDIEAMYEMFPSSVGALEKIANSDTDASKDATAMLQRVRRTYNLDYSPAIINNDGTLNKKASFDNLEEYKACKIIERNKDRLSAAFNKNMAFIYIESCENIKSISVSTDKEVAGMKNADGSNLEKNKLYVFDINTKNAKTFTFNVLTDENNEYTFERNTNFTVLDYCYGGTQIEAYSLTEGIQTEADVMEYIADY